MLVEALPLDWQFSGGHGYYCAWVAALAHLVGMPVASMEDGWQLFGQANTAWRACCLLDWSHVCHKFPQKNVLMSGLYQHRMTSCCSSRGWRPTQGTMGTRGGLTPLLLQHKWRKPDGAMHCLLEELDITQPVAWFHM